MCNKELENWVKDIHETFKVEVAICEIFKRRWSYSVGTEKFITGKHKIKINDKYGIIINCEDKQLEKIKNFIEQRKD